LSGGVIFEVNCFVSNAKIKVNFENFCVCSENSLSRSEQRNTLIEMPALELFWGNPNGQFFTRSGGIGSDEVLSISSEPRHHLFYLNKFH